MSKVLLLGAGTQGLIIAKDLKSSGHNVIMIIDHYHNYGDDSKYVEQVFQCLYDFESDDYLKTVIDIVLKNNVETIIPMGDKAASFLSKNKKKLTRFVRFKMPLYKDFIMGYDKENLMSICDKGGYPHPKTITNIDNIKSINLNAIRFPVLIKPNVSCGARGITLAKSKLDLIEKFPTVVQQYGKCHVQELIPEGGRQVEVQLYINENKELVNSSVISKFRWYPEKAGSSCCAESINNREIVDILYNLLLDLNWVGFADFDTIEDPRTGELLIMELNPRVPACVKTAIVSGVRWGNVIVNDYLDKEQESYNYDTGMVLRHIGFDILWFLGSKNRFKTKPSWFNFFGKNIYYQDFDPYDFKPFLYGTLNNIKKLFSKSFVKSKKL